MIANRVGVENITVTAMTASTSPLVTPVSFGWVFLHDVEVRIPTGHNGYTGFAIVQNGVGIVPYDPVPEFIIASDEILSFPVDTEVDSQFAVWTYNTDQYNHTFYFRFFYTPVALMTPEVEATAWHALYQVSAGV